ncbi:hypothetical protein ACU4HD_25335 [Cupriavidus basilensis]
MAVGVVAQSTVSVYVLQLYAPAYAVRQLHLPAAQSFAKWWCFPLNGGLRFLLSPVMGALSGSASAASASCFHHVGADDPG